jgi:hypothetical protein
MLPISRSRSELMKRVPRLVFATVLLVVAFVVSAAAQEPVGEFRPVAPGDLDTEQIPAARLVFAAYAFVWVAFVAYLGLLWQRMKRVETDLADVRTKLGGPGR